MQDPDVAVMQNLTSQTLENNAESTAVPGSVVESQNGVTQAQVPLR